MRKSILITGGAGFIGSYLAVNFKKHFPRSSVIVIDSLVRKGSSHNVSLLKKYKIKFIKGDVKNKAVFSRLPKVNILIDCAADSRVLAGYKSSVRELVDSNFLGTINSLDYAARVKADFIFLSTSRVYPFDKINCLNYTRRKSRFYLACRRKGVSLWGIREDFPLQGIHSFYGATKLASEYFIKEYAYAYNLRTVINRCSIISGPGQFGHSKQGIVSYWLASFLFKRPLKYIGWGGEGLQVRDALHIADLFNLVLKQIKHIEKIKGKIYNVGGGQKNSFSLKELSHRCQKITANKIKVDKIKKDRPADVIWYISDCRRLKNDLGWKPQKTLEDILEDTKRWIINNRRLVSSIIS